MHLYWFSICAAGICPSLKLRTQMHIKPLAIMFKCKPDSDLEKQEAVFMFMYFCVVVCFHHHQSTIKLKLESALSLLSTNQSLNLTKQQTHCNGETIQENVASQLRRSISKIIEKTEAHGQTKVSLGGDKNRDIEWRRCPAEMQRSTPCHTFSRWRENLQIFKKM